MVCSVYNDYIYIYTYSTYTYRIALMHFASVGLEPFGLAQCIRPLVQRIQTLSPGISFASAELCSAQPHFTSCKVEGYFCSYDFHPRKHN